jgi:hypothetical protein
VDILFDIDGTLADTSHRIHHLQKTPKDWDAFYDDSIDDAVIEPIKDILRAAYSFGHDIIFCTGRPERLRNTTINWLSAHVTAYAESITLCMRKEGDHRNDDIVKEEMLDTLLLMGYQPKLVFEDRKRVADMFRRRGLIVAHVAEGDF